MASRRYARDSSPSDYDDRRERSSRNGPRGYDERYVDDEIDYRARGPPRDRDRERERDVLVREDVRESTRSPPAYLREGYGRTSAGPVVLRARETEEFEFDARSRRRSPSPDLDRKVDREEIVIKRDGGDRDRRGLSSRDVDRDRDEVLSRRGGSDRRPGRGGGGGGGDYDREEIIIRRDEKDSDDRDLRYGSRRYDGYPSSGRPVSHERERSQVRHRGSDGDQEIIIRREEREGRGGDREREEIIIRKTSRSRSPSPSGTSIRGEAPIIQAPPIHQEVITHHRHIDHGYELAIAHRPLSRPPSPPMPPAPRDRSEERIEIRRTGERNGRAYDEDIVIDRNERGGRSRNPYYDPSSRPPHHATGLIYPPDEQDEEAEYYNNRAMDRSYPGEAYHGATRDWAIVDVPPGTNRVRMDGAGGGSQEITWQKYNGVRRSKFYPDGYSDEGYGSEIARPAPGGGDIGRRYGRERDSTEGLWTEITKDLVIKEAIIEMGYEYEETDDFYYIISYLRYEDVARLVGLSEDIRKERRRRVKDMEYENRILPLPPIPVEEPIRPTPRLMIEDDNTRITSTRYDSGGRGGGGDWDREDERYIEREIVYRGGRPPLPPPGIPPGRRY